MPASRLSHETVAIRTGRLLTTVCINPPSLALRVHSLRQSTDSERIVLSANRVAGERIVLFTNRAARASFPVLGYARLSGAATGCCPLPSLLVPARRSRA